MCTVVCRWSSGEAVPVQLLALRDELLSRAFDLPGAWWADQPEVIGGRDRQAGGSWCVSDIASGVTAVVLNRPEHRIAEPGAPSRGVLPLLAVAHREHWTDFLETTGMAGFHLVLASPESLLWWSFDGQHLQRDALPADTYMFTPDGLAPAFDERLATGYAHFAGDPAAPTAQVWAQWLAVVDETVASADPSGLLVRRPLAGDSYETVFGQFIAARPGALRLDYLAHPDSGREWTTKLWRTGAHQMHD